MQISGPGACLLCRQLATVTDWPEWVAVEDCACLGYFMSKPLWQHRLPQLSDVGREELVARIRAVRVHRTEAWLSTTDARMEGPIVISPVRTGNAASPRPDTSTASRR